MSAARPIASSLRWAIIAALGVGLAACGDKPAPATTAPAATAAADQAAQAQAAAQAALAALSVDELKTRGRQALREQRIYAPAGDNAIEYYLALRKKSDKPDASAESALMDLSPYAVIAAEQAIARNDFTEAERLRGLIAAADPQAPSLARIADAITKGRAALAAAPPPPAEKTPEQLRAEQLAREQAAAEARELQAAAAAAAAQRQPEITGPTPAPAAPTPAPQPPPQQAQEAAPQPAVPPPARPAQPSRPASELVAISTPQPAYPPEAARSGTSGEVVLSFTVNTDGSVSDIDIVSARPRGVFERSAQAAVRRWRFQPIASPQQVTRTFSFSR